MVAKISETAAQRFVPWDIDVARLNFGANCGPVSFAVATAREVCRSMQYFPHFETKPWTNLTQMRGAFQAAGIDTVVCRRAWPTVGVVLIQWLGPWTKHHFFSRWSLVHTHWIAVERDYVFDHTEEQWMPREEWARAVVPLFLKEIPQATGWDIKYGVESNNKNWRSSTISSIDSTTGAFSFSR
jgi:hypothetical protein